MINKVVIVGRMTKEADLRFTPNSKAVANFTVACKRPFGNDETDFINCVIWNKSAENLANFTRKGSLVGVTGSIQTRSFDGQDGKKVYVTEVVSDSVQFLDSRSNSNGNVTETPSNIGTLPNNSFNDPFGNGSKTIDIDDSDLPF